MIRMQPLRDARQIIVRDVAKAQAHVSAHPSPLASTPPTRSRLRRAAGVHIRFVRFHFCPLRQSDLAVSHKGKIALTDQQTLLNQGANALGVEEIWRPVTRTASSPMAISTATSQPS